MADLGFPVNGSDAERLLWARDRSKQGRLAGGYAGTLRERLEDMRDHYNDGGIPGYIGAGIRHFGGAARDALIAAPSPTYDALTSEPAKAFYRGITGKERQAASPTSVQGQAGTTGQSSQVQQSKAAGAVPSQPNQAAANASAAGNNASKQGFGYITIGGKKYPLKGEPSGINRVNMDDGGVMVWGHTGGDDTRNFQYAIGHGPLRERRTQAQPRGLHYVPGGWANDGYSFEGSAEDRARFFAPVSGPGRAPRSDNDTFLALQRQKAMQPVEQPLPERPEFPADRRRMGWHTKLAKYQADMDAYNRQMANIAGYRQAMDVAALQQMPKPTDPVEQARLERALALQERQAAQQAAYQQAQLDQQRRMNHYNQMTGMADYLTKMNQLGYQQREAELVDNYRRALLAGDAKAADAAKAVLEVYRGKEMKDDNKNGRFAHATSEDAMGNKKTFLYDTQTGEKVDNANIPSIDTPEAVKMRQDNSAYLKEVMKRAAPKQREELAGLESFIHLPNFREMVDEYMRKGR